MKYFFALLIVIISGCATTEKYVVDPNYSDQDLSTLIIYRTKTAFHSLNPELPFIYIDEAVAAKLSVGAYKTVKVPPGKHRLSVRQSILFMPGSESDSFEHVFEPGQTYYLRYSMDFGGAVPIGNSVSVYGSSRFGLTSKENFEQRK